MTSPNARRKPLSEREAAAIGPRVLKDPRSVSYAWQTVSLLKDVYGRREVSLRDWAATLADAERHEIFNRIPPEKPYGSMDAMLKAEVGVTLQESVSKLAARADETRRHARENPEAAGKHGGDRSEQGAKSKNGHLATRGTNQASTRIRRLRRDHPDVAARLDAGEFKSVAAAERASRGEEPNPPRRMPAALGRVLGLLPKLSRQERGQLRLALDRLDEVQG
jgi:hypothetical protein